MGDPVSVVLTKNTFSVGEHNKLSTRKSGPLEIIEKITNAYGLKLSDHIRTADDFNAKYLIPFIGDHNQNTFHDHLNLMANSLRPRENDRD